MVWDSEVVGCFYVDYPPEEADAICIYTSQVLSLSVRVMVSRPYMRVGIKTDGKIGSLVFRGRLLCQTSLSFL